MSNITTNPNAARDAGQIPWPFHHADGSVSYHTDTDKTALRARDEAGTLAMIIRRTSDELERLSRYISRDKMDSSGMKWRLLADARDAMMRAENIFRSLSVSLKAPAGWDKIEAGAEVKPGRTVYWLTSDIPNSGVDTDVFGSEKEFESYLCSIMQERCGEITGWEGHHLMARAERVLALMSKGEVMEAWAEFRGDNESIGEPVHHCEDSYHWGEQVLKD